MTHTEHSGPGSHSAGTRLQWNVGQGSLDGRVKISPRVEEHW